MSDSLGGTVLIAIIVFFIVLVSSYMAYNVNYMRAFNMKNKIIEMYERYDGNCANTATECDSKISDYASDIGYKPATLNCTSLGSGYTQDSRGYYCYKVVTEYKDGESSGAIKDRTEGHYYKIVTRINIHIPVIDNLLGINVFNVTGDTKVIYPESTTDGSTTD